MSLRRYAFFGLLILAGWWMFRPASPAQWSGRPAVAEPQQTTGSLPATWQSGEYAFTPLARIEGKSVVLSRQNYDGGHNGELCPTDFALGWGVMSDAAVINTLKLSQDMRWFFYSWRGPPPAPPGEMAISAANMHLIPANAEVRRALKRVHRHNLLTFSGYLVEVRHRDGWSWRSSLTRSDTGGGACEVVWVEKIARAAIPTGTK